MDLGTNLTWVTKSMLVKDLIHQRYNHFSKFKLETGHLIKKN